MLILTLSRRLERIGHTAPWQPRAGRDPEILYIIIYRAKLMNFREFSKCHQLRRSRSPSSGGVRKKIEYVEISPASGESIGHEKTTI